MIVKKFQKSSDNFICEKCDYTTSRKSQYDRHITTAKHKMVVNGSKKVPTTSQHHICSCGRQYKYDSGYYRHKKQCYSASLLDSYVIPKPTCDGDTHIDANSMLDLIKQNQEFKNMLLDQNQKMMELVQSQSVIQTTNNNTTNNNNQKFNLNFFLNTTCKDAINMTEFIQNMEVQMSELENIGHNGYVAGMTDLILKKLKGLDVSKRPMHCTDLKRETVYIKDKDRWDKDNADKGQLRRAITLVAKKNYGKTLEWREHNPECLVVGSEKYDFCFNMMRNVLGDFEEEQIKLDNKVIKNLAKEVVVDRY